VAKNQLTCQVSVRFEPLPLEKRTSYYYAFDLLAELLLANLEKEAVDETAMLGAGETFRDET